MIDVIIPAYNAHDTIKKTLDSISIQTIRDMIKVYIVDDGSKNGYSEICKEYKDILNIHELKLEKNMGPGYAREYGINNSHSKYILFLDSDDVLYDSKSVYNLYEKINNEKLDIVISKTYKENNNHDLDYCDFHMHDLHGKIFRRNLIKKNNIHFLNTRCNEDTMFFYMALLSSKIFGAIDDITYIYNYNINSITNSEDFWFKNIKVFSENSCILIDFIYDHNINLYTGAGVIGNILMILYLEYIYNLDRKDSDKIIKWVKPFYKKARKLLNLLDNNMWEIIENNYYDDEIRKISFDEFKNLLSK